MLTLKRAICRNCVTQFFAYDIFLLNFKKSLSKHSDKASFVTLVFATMNWSSASETGTFFLNRLFSGLDKQILRLCHDNDGSN